MQPSLIERTQRKVWLPFGLIVVGLLSIIFILSMTNSEPVDAAQEVTLHSTDLLIVKSDNCNLNLLSFNQLRARIGCVAIPPTATATATPTGESGLRVPAGNLVSASNLASVSNLAPANKPGGMFKFTSDVSSAPDAKIVRTLKAGKKLKVSATLGECALSVKKQTPTEIRIKCNAVATRTPTPRPTSIPPGPDGRWEGRTDQSGPLVFWVTQNRTSWDTFIFRMYSPNCYFDIGVPGPGPMRGNQIYLNGIMSGQFTGTFNFTGTFANNTYVKGTYSFNNVGYPGCGSVTRNGQWDAHWKAKEFAKPAPGKSSVLGDGWYVRVTPR